MDQPPGVFSETAVVPQQDFLLAGEEYSSSGQLLMRVLVVEDDKKIASFVVNGLKQSGFAVDHCADGEEALIMARGTSYDAAVVDIMLPKLDGLSLLQTLRREGVRTPVILLSAKASVDDRVRGLQA